MLKWLLTPKAKPETPSDDSTDALRKRVLRLEMQLSELSDEFGQLVRRHERLAKRTYGEEGGRPRGASGGQPESLEAFRQRALAGVPTQRRLLNNDGSEC